MQIRNGRAPHSPQPLLVQSGCKRRRRIVDGRALEPWLLLFACFVVRQLAVNATNYSAVGSTAAVSSTSG
ncbi:MAG TPA: hypothetical protein VK532_04835 [Gaiellaceae bacterium]|nr:hypothetical protein [Gaiellaceae bacterium]